jgi:catechol 2,3-dioxygenase-like lactoylglutathione lyase family enzyme
MSPQEAKDSGSAMSVRATSVDMKLEVIVIPVSNVDRAKDFYANLGWRLDADRTAGDAFSLVQFTPFGSACSIQFRHWPHADSAGFDPASRSPHRP